MNIKKSVNKLLSFVLVGTLLIGSTVTSFATEKPVPVQGVQWIDSDIEDNMNSAEAAAAEAETAAKAAQAAADAAEAAADAINDTKDVSGNTVEDLIEDAEQKTNLGTVSGNENVLDSVVKPAEEIAVSANEYIADQENKIGVSANEAKDDAQVEADKAAEEAALAAAALVKADAALEEAKAATNGTDAQAAADNAKLAYEEANQAAMNAETYYENALKIMEAAQEAYDKAVLEAKGEIGNYTEELEAAIAAAEAAFEQAQEAVTLAQNAYNNALSDKADIKQSVEKAQAAADLAKESADIAGVSSNNIDKVVKEPVQVAIEDAKSTVSSNEATLENAKNTKTGVDASQDAAIASYNKDKSEAEKQLSSVQSQIDTYQDAKKVVDDLEATNLFKWTSDISNAKQIVSQGLGHYVWFIWVGNTQQDLDNANNTIKQYNAATAIVNETNKLELDSKKSNLTNTIRTAQNNITIAEAAKTAAAKAVTDAQNDLTSAKTAQKVLEDNLATFNYTDEATEISYTDKNDEAQYKALMAEMIEKSNSYNEIYNDVEKYEWATADQSFLDILSGIFTGSTWDKFFNELGLESKYHGWYTQNGTYIIIQNNKDNTESLILIKNDRAYILEKEQGELASYIAAFDKIAAAQAASNAALAAEKAAQAAQVVLDAQARLDAAQTALDAAKSRLEQAKINELDLENANGAFAAAELEVRAASLSYELAQDNREASLVDYQEAQKIANSFIVTKTSESPSSSSAKNTTTTPVVSQNKIVAVAPETTVIEEAPVALASVARTTNVRTNTVIDEEETPLVATIEDTEEAVTDEADVIEENTVIEDEEAPLAAELVENSFNWWWLLLVVALVAAASFGGYQYNKNNKKKIIDKTSTK